MNLIERYIMPHHATQAVNYRRHCHCSRCIAVAVHFVTSSRKVKHRTTLQRKCWEFLRT